MSGDDFDAAYYRRRATSQTKVAEGVADDRVRQIHHELARLYGERAEMHANRACGGLTA